MACAITVYDVVGTVSGGSLTALTVSGTVTDCTSIKVSVFCSTGGNSLTGVATGSTTQSTWSITFSGAILSNFICTCGQTVEVQATCATDPTCRTVRAITINCPDDGPSSYDCTKTCKKWFCPLLFLIMTLSFAFAIAFIILDSCLALAGGLINIGTVFLLIGIIAIVLYYYYPDCRKCLCGWVYKLFWRVLFAVGILITTFAGCCKTFLILGLVMIAVGLVFLYWWKKKCKKTVCEVVKEVIFVIAAFILPPLIFLLSLANVQVCFLVLFTIGNFAFSFWDLILIVFYLLVLYDQANC